MEERESSDYFGPGNRYVKELTPSDFESNVPYKMKESIAKGQCGMILFYAPWCPHCKAVKPIWEEAAKVAGFYNFYAFNCEKYKNHIMKIKEELPELIAGYPSIIFYKHGSPKESYSDDRTVDKLIKACMNYCKSK